MQVYNSSGGTLQGALEFGSAGSEGHGHSNRVFCVAFHPDDSNVLFSGGWDHTVQARLSMENFNFAENRALC